MDEEGKRGAAAATMIVAAMYFVLGFVTWLNGPLIAFVKLAFTLDDVSAFLVPMVFYMSYFFLALPSAWLLRRTGMKRGMAIGLFAMAVGAAIFGQSATMRVFSGALSGLFVIGAGLAVLQTAVNPYVTAIGPIESAARRIAIMGICNKVAGILAPVAIGALVLSGVGSLAAQVGATADPAAREALLDQFAARIHAPYLAMAGLLALLALFILKSPLPDIRTARRGAPAADAAPGRGLTAYPHLMLGVLCLFLYVGVEVLAGDAIGAYGRGFGLPIEATALYTSYTLAAMLIGYLAGVALIPRFVSQERYLGLSAALGILLSFGAWATTGVVSVGFVAALGFANAMMWPAIFPLAIRGLGRHTEAGSALLVMAICGGAVLPQLFAVLKETIPFQLVFLALTAPSYAYILFYATIGSRPAER
ncbi:MAG: sugar MFS transporter [Sphingomonas fennica]